jgi:phosphopantothenoylcysteine decarboxylase/phosphopantothenate--cysteine ligase
MEAIMLLGININNTNTMVGVWQNDRWLLARKNPLSGCRFVVSAGATREPMDPVRFMSNRSSGKMGYALAAAAGDRGAEVSLIHGPTALSPGYGIQAIAVETALQMQEAVLDATSGADVLVMAAAATDFRSSTVADQKIKKKEAAPQVNLEINPDILQSVADRRKTTRHPQVLVGFAAETENLIAHAREKLECKKLDLIAANDVSAGNSGFAVDTNQVTLLDAAGKQTALPLMSKMEVAETICDQVVRMLNERNRSVH